MLKFHTEKNSEVTYLFYFEVKNWETTPSMKQLLIFAMVHASMISLVFHLPSSCPAVSRSPRFSSLNSSSLTLSMSTTVDRTFISASCSTVRVFAHGFTLSFRAGFASFMRPVFDCLCGRLLGGSGSLLSFLVVDLDLEGWMEFSFEDFSMMARGSTARSIEVMTLENFLLCGSALGFVLFPLIWRQTLTAASHLHWLEGCRQEWFHLTR